MNWHFKIITFSLIIFSFEILGDSDRGMLPQGYEWRECRTGMVIECKTTECDSICAANIQEEKEEKENEREETIESLIDKGEQDDSQEKNPALFQVEQ